MLFRFPPIVNVQAQNELDRLVPSISSAFQCARTYLGVLHSAESDPTTSSTTLGCIIDAFEEPLSLWASPIAETILSLPSHPDFVNAVVGLMVDAADVSPAAAAVLVCLSKGLSSQHTAFEALLCVTDAIAEPVDKRLLSTISVAEMVAPPGGLPRIQEILATSVSPTLQGLIQALNEALSRRAPQPLQVWRRCGVGRGCGATRSGEEKVVDQLCNLTFYHHTTS